MSTEPVRNVPGLGASVKPSDRHPKWYPPTPESATQPAVMMMNSLTETIEEFKPRQGRLVKWYTCGPTVYDMSHMGHARAYLTFDILRRIMEDYFGYAIEYQMNITDIDDKIIKGARVNKLMADFRAEKPSLDVLKAKLVQAEALAKEKLDKRQAQLAEPLRANATSNEKKEREEKMLELDLKKKQFQETQEKVGKANGVDELFVAGAAFLEELLDAQKGGDVSDPEIFESHARKFEAAFLEDCDRLNIRPPDVISRVTEVVPQITVFIQRIIDNGFAYVGQSSVFFDTKAFQEKGHDYPKLKAIHDDLRSQALATADEMAEGEGSLSKAEGSEKRSPNDFALWKFAKPGEPTWDSPWGKGRPGWHIECSVMASEVLGENMDIHAGGCDLKFPHHDNEMAQAEAYWKNHQWVNYFLHCGHLHIKGLKMSKSLKNFITIRQALDDLGVTPREMRLIFLANDWHRQMDFSDQNIEEARERERSLRSFFGEVEIALRESSLKQTQGFNEHDTQLEAAWVKAERAIHASLCNNFDTATVMIEIKQLTTAVQAYVRTGERKSATLLRKIGRYVTKILQVLGVVDGRDNIGFGATSSNGAEEEKIRILADAVVKFRDEVRRVAREDLPPKSLLTMCDAVRDEWLPPAGIRVDDKPGAPSVWKQDDPQTLLREIREKKAEVEAAASKKRKEKLVNQIGTLKKRVSKYEPFTESPTTYFRHADRIAKYDPKSIDDQGLPTRLADGTSVDEKMTKKLKKDLEKYASTHKELIDLGGATFLAEEKAKVSTLEAELATL